MPINPPDDLLDPEIGGEDGEWRDREEREEREEDDEEGARLNESTREMLRVGTSNLDSFPVLVWARPDSDRREGMLSELKALGVLGWGVSGFLKGKNKLA